MAIDKTKVAQNAQKLVQKGQLDKAIKEYQLLVDADPKDIRSLLKIAELHGKLNQKADSIKTFRKVADQYNKSGFYTKAVAVLRQAIEVDTKQVDLYTLLAELYQKLGLIKDAILQLNTAARLLQDDGKHTQALDVLERMREFDGNDPSVLARYGEALFNAGQKDKAIGIFRSLISNLKETNNNDDLIRFCERILNINPDDIEALKDLSRAYVKVGLANKALLKLKALFDRNVLDAELYDLLDRSYSLLGKEDKAVHAQVEKAKYLLSQGKGVEARQAYEYVLEREPGNSDAIAYLRPSRSNIPRTAAPAAAPSAAPKVAPAPAAAKPVPTAPKAPPPGADAGHTTASKQLSKFLTEADVYLKYGLRDKAIEQLENVLQHDQNNIAARRKLVEIYVEENPGKAAVHLRAMADISESLGEVSQAKVYLNRADELDPAVNSAPASNVVGPAAEEVDTDTGFLDEDDITVEAGDFEPDEAEVEVEVDNDDSIMTGGIDDDGGASDAKDFSGIGNDLDNDMGSGFLDEDEVDEGNGVLDIDDSGPNLSEELDEAEFYIQQGILNEAREIYERILAKHPGQPIAQAKLEWIDVQESGSKKSAAPAAVEAKGKVEASSHSEPLFDLAAELEEELDFGEEATAVQESDEPPSFEDIFSQFKKGVERELKDDAGAHYDLGIAYKEMGLVKDAIGEFEIALKSPEKQVESSNMIAICYQEIGQPEKAIEFYKQGIDGPGCPPEASLNMNYELACLYESLDDVRNAVSYFKKVIDQDKTYRDVADKVRALKARVQSGKAFA